jgi:hypothetical protein
VVLVLLLVVGGFYVLLPEVFDVFDVFDVFEVFDVFDVFGVGRGGFSVMSKFCSFILKLILPQ